MQTFRRRSVRIWFGLRQACIVKIQRSWFGTIQECQACIYDYPEEWNRSADSTFHHLQQLVRIYSLQPYRATFIVGGPSLRWKLLDIPAEKRREALQMADWDGISSGAVSCELDVQRRRKRLPSGGYEWIAAAYPSDSIQYLLDAWHRICCTWPERIDVLPAVAGRWHRDSGSLYICEPGQVHVMVMEDGEVITYQCIETLPPEGAELLRQHGCKEGSAIVWLNGNGSRWSLEVGSQASRKLAAQWDLSPAAAMVASD
ncbi:hypothetical protein [uncultured Megasphaera sp.]|uniref:hypothetical protein n=1 Tax=uncultured Megasphaera sp. TaxID=165188 RepID=UPI002659FD1D|nr:hypothetical protein [uncultured Megasphaera sp.]